MHALDAVILVGQRHEECFDAVVLNVSHHVSFELIGLRQSKQFLELSSEAVVVSPNRLQAFCLVCSAECVTGLGFPRSRQVIGFAGHKKVGPSLPCFAQACTAAPEPCC